MKKMILTVAIALATFSGIQAKNYDKFDFDQNQQKIESVEDVIHVNDSTPYIIKFYDIDKLTIKNDSNATIRIYDEHWKLILETNKDVDKTLTGGNYYVACSCKIKTSYVERN